MDVDAGARPPRGGGEEPLVSIGEAALERMPALGLLFEETASAFVRDFARDVDAAPVMVFEALEAMRASDLTAVFDPSTAVLAFRSHGLDALFAVALDAKLQNMALDALLGSSVLEIAPERRRTRIEDRLLSHFCETLLAAFASAAASLTEISFLRAPEAEEDPFRFLGPKGAVAIVARFSVQLLNGEGAVAIIAARSAFDPFREKLSRLPGVDSKGQDERWSDDLYAHVVQTDVRVDVKIEARGFLLGEIAQLRTGDVLRLPVAPTSLIRVASEGRTLFWCSLGQKDGRYTVRIEEFSDERQSFIENVLGV